MNDHDRTVLHVLCNEGNDIHFEEEHDDCTVSGTIESNSYLINNISYDEFQPEARIESDETEFTNKLKRSIFELGIYEYVQ